MTVGIKNIAKSPNEFMPTGFWNPVAFDALSKQEYARDVKVKWIDDFDEYQKRLKTEYGAYIDKFNYGSYFNLISTTILNIIGGSDESSSNSKISLYDIDNSIQKSEIVSSYKENFKEKYYNKLKSFFESCGTDDESIAFLEKQLSELMYINREESLNLLQTLFVENMESSKGNVILYIQILRIISDYDYNFMKPYSQLMVSSAIHNKQPKVQLEALRVIDRWGNAEALNILENMEIPSHPWAKMKYDTLLKSLRNDLSKSS